MSRDDERRLTPLEACAYAATLVRKAGFVFDHASDKSTSCYYGFPGRVGLMRISIHTSKKWRRESRSIFGEKASVAHMTFSHKAVRDDGTYQRSNAAIDSEIASAIGRFMLCAGRAEP